MKTRRNPLIILLDISLLAAVFTTANASGGDSGSGGDVFFDGTFCDDGSSTVGATTDECTHGTGDVGGCTQTSGSTLNDEAGSVFEWKLGSSKDGAGGAAGTGLSGVEASRNIDGGTWDVIFRVVQGDAETDIEDLGDAFWDTPDIEQTWVMSGISGEDPESGILQGVETNIGVSTFGSAHINGSPATWTAAIPVPITVLVATLLGLGMLRSGRA